MDAATPSDSIQKHPLLFGASARLNVCSGALLQSLPAATGWLRLRTPPSRTKPLEANRPNVTFADSQRFSIELAFTLGKQAGSLLSENHRRPRAVGAPPAWGLGPTAGPATAASLRGGQSETGLRGLHGAVTLRQVVNLRPPATRPPAARPPRLRPPSSEGVLRCFSFKSIVDVLQNLGHIIYQTFYHRSELEHTTQAHTPNYRSRRLQARPGTEREERRRSEKGEGSEGQEGAERETAGGEEGAWGKESGKQAEREEEGGGGRG
jgi:hypothetical protein